MIKRKKLDKLKMELQTLGITDTQIAELKIASRPTLSKIFSGDIVSPEVLKQLVNLRDEKKRELKQVEEQI